MRYKIPSYMEYGDTYASKCEKAFFDKGILIINYFGNLFLMRKDGMPISSRNYRRLGDKINFDKWHFVVSNFRENNRHVSDLTSKQKKLARIALIIMEKDPLFGFTAEEKKFIVENVRKKAEKNEELQRRWRAIEAFYESHDPCTLVSIKLGAIYLNEQEKTYKKLEDYM